MQDEYRWNRLINPSPFEVTNRPLFHLAALKNFWSENFLEIIIKPCVADFIFSRTPCFRHILLNTFRRIRLKHEYYSLRHILKKIKTTFRLQSLIAENFIETHVK